MKIKECFTDDSDKVAIAKIYDQLMRDDAKLNFFLQCLNSLGGVEKVRLTRDRIKYPQSPMACNVYTMRVLGCEFSMTRTPLPTSDKSPKYRELLVFISSVYAKQRENFFKSCG